MQTTLNGEQTYTVIRQGYQISNEMKSNVINMYYKSLEQMQYKNKCDYIRQHLEIEYGLRWSVIVSNIHSDSSHSFIAADDCLLEFKTHDHHVLAYLVLPKIIPAPPQPSERIIGQAYRSEGPHYLSPDLNYRQNSNQFFQSQPQRTFYQKSINQDNRRPAFYDQMTHMFPYTGS